MADTGRPTLRVALLGLGWVTRTLWLPLLDEHPRFDVVAVHDPDPDAVAAARDRFPRAAVPDGAAGLRPGDVDLAVVASPTRFHADTAVDLLGRGIPTFVEKPVCVSSAEAARIADAERAGGARLLAGTAAWHRADVRALREVLDTVGPVRAVELSWVRARGVPDAGGWLTSGHAAGGGVLFDLGWHLLTVGMRALGWPDVTAVAAATSADLLHRPDSGARWRDGGTPANGTRPGVEDTVRAGLSTGDGRMIGLHAAWASHLDVDRTVVAFEGAAGRAELTCTFGLSPERVASRLLVRRHGTTEEVDVAAEEPGAEYRRQVDLLPTLLADPGQPGAATTEVVRTVALIERIHEAAGARPAAPVGGGTP